MENRKLIKYIPILILGFLFSFNSVFAYSVKTHALLSNHVVKFYNQNFPNQPVSEDLAAYLIDGARLEDNMPRYLHHFYDPINNRGLDDLGFKGMASKDWVQNKDAQTAILYRLMPQTEASLLSATQIDKIKPIFKQTNFTWQKAVDLYAQGDTEAAFFTLGHIVHLIEDAAVPDHTRNDGHPPYDDGGSPYENWTEQFSLDNPDKDLAGRLAGKKPVILGNLSAYFDAMAKYSNNNFYSRDSIKNYELPKADSFRKIGDYNYGIKFDNEGEYILGIYLKSDFDYSKEENLEIILKEKVGEYKVLPDYWHRLSVKAVQHAAGAIDLFFKEAEIAKQKYLTAKVQRPYLATFIDGFKAIFGNGPVRDPSDLINELKKPVAEITLDEKPILEETEAIEEIGQVIKLSPNLDEEILNAPAVEKPAVKSPTSPALTPETGSPAGAALNQAVFSGQSDNAPACKFNADLNPSRQNLIINEAAWMGTSVSASNEWLELKNISGGALNISGWKVIDKGEQLRFVFDDGTVIPAGGLLLLERTDDDSVPFVKADGVYTGALSNSDEGLQLFDKNCSLTDEVLADPNWPAGDNAEKRTMERGADLSWHTYSGSGNNGIFGTPKAENSLPAETLSAQSAPEPEPQPEVPLADQPAPQTNVSHIVISEFLFDAEGSDSGKEFIELYNPTDQPVDLLGWSIQHLSASGSLTKKNFEEGDALAPKGFFLIWLGSGSAGSPQADMVWASGSLNNTGATISLINDSVTIDSVTYDINQLVDFSASKSLERKAWQNNACLSAQNSGEYLGNSCDTDSLSDWETRAVPQPQNSRNLPEPRQVAAVEELSLVYDPSALGISFEWDADETLLYRLSDVSNASSTLLIATSTGQFYKNITEIGREYKFEITAIDAEGLASEPVPASVFAPSFFDILAFYQDPRSASSSPQYLLDMSWKEYPFVPNSQKWQVVIFYYNQEAPVTGDLFWIDYSGSNPYKSWGSVAPNGFLVVYPNCMGTATKGASLILPVTSDSCISFANNQAAKALNWNRLEDSNLLVAAAAENFASSSPVVSQDFVSAAFYSFQPGYEPNNYGIRQVAIDKAQYFFQDSVFARQPPSVPANVNFSFDGSQQILSISWDNSTDPDSLDNLINYEVFNGSTTVAVSNTSVQVQVEPVARYVFEIRAKDELGNLSEPAVAEYDVPDISLPYVNLTKVEWGNLESASSTVLKLEFSDYPFMDFNDTGAMIFFLNQPPAPGYSFLDDDYRKGDKIGGTNNVLKLSYYPCDFSGQWGSKRTVAGLILRNQNCPPHSRGLKISELLSARLNSGDIGFSADVIGDFTAGDYITIGFYRLGTADKRGTAYFTNVANYNKKIYFTE